jgi:two-component sensor histidine kinase
MPGARGPARPDPDRDGTALWQAKLSAYFGRIRVRLALIVLIAAVPLLILSATLALQNYHLALHATAATASRLRESAIARHASAIGGARQVLQALSEGSDLVSGDPQDCDQRLAAMLALQSARYVNFAVSNDAGNLVCSALPLSNDGIKAMSNARNGALFEAARARGDLVLGPIRPSALSGRDVIPAIYPIMRGGKVAGFLYAGLRMDWFSRPADTPSSELKAVWIVDSSHHVTQVASTGALGLPPTPLMRQLEQAPDVVGARSAGGAPYAYASALLGDGYSMIVAYPAADDRAAARSLLIRRVGQLGLLLLLGLAAVAIGVHLFLVEPLGDLSAAVAQWRATGRFNPAQLRMPPTELREMAISFAEAIQSLAEHADRHRAAVAQQELLMKEIHHRVKNNLQIVASLLNLQASRIRLPEARAEFASARDRVRALATLHRHLYLQGEVHTINMPLFLTELCDQLFQAMGETAGKRIKLDIAASPLQMSSDQAVPLSLIVTEAVSNALKYAFPGGRAGHVSVRLSSDGQTADLVVEDNGIGIPAGRADTESGPRDGIGITLIRGFARQLGATLTVDETNGTRYSVHIPLNRAAQDSDLAA